MVNDTSVLREDIDSWWIDRMYLQDAWRIAQMSADPSTQVGAALVIPNGHGVVMRDCNRIHDRLLNSGYPLKPEDKNLCTEHAERKVIYRTVGNRIPTDGMTMYCTWACCSECARAIIEFGIVRVVTLRRLVERTPERWQASVWSGLRMLNDCGIAVVGWSGDLGVTSQILFGGKPVGNGDLA